MEMNNDNEDDKWTPRWAHRAEHMDNKPSWVDAIPHELWQFGEVFFPIPNRQKAWKYPFFLQEKRFSADDEIMNAYLESNSNYGICCANDLAVVDIDDLDYHDQIVEDLPDTVWQISGSREGKHYFFKSPGLTDRIILEEEPFKDTSIHIGEVKCDPHGFVVGPGSTHPSGNDYGPLKGDEVAEITPEEMREALSDFIIEEKHTVRQTDVDYDNYKKDSGHDFYNLSADDVLPWLEHEKRIAHPVHGSSTGSNFMKNSDGDTFTCWRCQFGAGDGCGLSGAQFLAAEATGLDCDDIRSRWRGERFDEVIHYKGWRRAVEKGLVSPHPIKYTFLKGYSIERDIVDREDELEGEQYWTVKNALKYELTYWEKR